MSFRGSLVLRWLAKAPRGGFRIVRFLARRFPSLQAYPISLRLVPDVTVEADLRESVWFPLFRYGWYPHQVAEDRLSLHVLRQGDSVWDIGANIGYTSLLFAYAVGPAGYVLAVEPGRKAFPMLVRTIRPHRNVVRPLQAAVSDAMGEIEFADGDMLDRSAVVPEGANGYKVRSITLDSLLEQPDIRPPDFLKIDVEGHEARAFQGAERLVRRHHPMIEFEALDTSARIATISALSRAAQDEYFYFRIRHDGFLAPHDERDTPDLTHNYLAATTDHLPRLPHTVRR